MAKMIPALFSSSAYAGSKAEEKLYHALKNCLDDSYTVFHSFDFFLRNLQSKLIEAEIDFLILSPQWGILVLEVKGGVVGYDGTRWLQNSIPLDESPYHQAKKNKYALSTFLKNKMGREPSLPFGHAVCFPDVFTQIKTLTADADPAITITNGEIPYLDSVVPEIMRLYQKDSAASVSKAEYEMVRKALMPEFEYGAALADIAGASEQIIFRLTEEQCRLLDFIGDRKRVLVKGSAGTGKTVLALKKAKELAAEGKKVLLLCYNKLLAELLQKSVSNAPGDITAINYHSFCLNCLQKEGIEPATRPDDQFWRYEIPERFLKLLEKKPLRYDAIIVDEAQDFMESYWITIDSMLDVHGYLYVFYDPDQNLYQCDLRLPIAGQPFILTANCRNTRRIAEALKNKTGYEAKIKDDAPDGVPVSEIFCATDQEARKELSRILHQLVQEQGIEPDRIVIIGGHKLEHTFLADNQKAGNFLIEHEPEPDSKAIRYCTYMKFKGCEADAVIVLGYDPKDPGWARPNALYAAMSRAKYLLYILHR